MIVLLFAHFAAANPIYSGVIKLDLDLDYYPTCTLCHLTDRGGALTASKPFAVTAQDYGLTGDSADELPGILDAMEKDETDSDGDGSGDIQELLDGTDPNASGGTVGPPQYGCLSTAPRTAPGALLAFVAFAFARRRRCFSEAAAALAASDYIQARQARIDAAIELTSDETGRPWPGSTRRNEYVASRATLS